MLTLSRQGYLHQLYRFTYGVHAPENFCPFFWKVLLAAVLLPVTWLSYPCAEAGFFTRLWNTFMLWTLLVGLAFSIWFTLAVNAIILYVLGILLGILLGMAVAVVIVDWVVDRKPSRAFEALREITSVLSTKKDSFMDKYCPKINWR